MSQPSSVEVMHELQNLLRLQVAMADFRSSKMHADLQKLADEFPQLKDRIEGILKADIELLKQTTEQLKKS